MDTNVVLLTVDCLRYDRCGFNGYYGNTTPVLDRLAEESYLFDRAYAPGTWTSESFPGILAGSHAPDVAYWNEPRYKSIPRGAPTIASRLGANGYHTVATITNPQLSVERNFDRGFDRFSNLIRERRGHGRPEGTDTNDDASAEDSGPDGAGEEGSALDALVSAVGERYSANELLARLRGRSGLLNPYAALFYLRGVSMLRDAPEEWPTVRSERVLDRFTNALADAADRQPFFAWTHLMDLHAPLHPGTVTRNRNTPARAYALGRYVLADTVRALDGQPRRYSRLYDEALRYVDTQVRRVVDTLRSAGVWENTVLIVTSDHGEAMGERGVNGHRNHYTYDELLQVPLLVHTPDGAGEGDRIDAPFSLSWVHELIAETAGLDPMGLPARSPSGTHLDDPEDGRLAVADSLTPFGHTVVVRDREHKLVEHFDGWVPEDRGERYDLMRHLGIHTADFGPEVFDGLNILYRPSTDPCERTPLPPSEAPSEHHERAAAVHTRVEDLPRIEGRPDAKTTEMLRDLGYL
jgi:choline-sulfatase